jgi:hypothetical protein
MIQTKKPHIRDLAARLRLAYSHAKDHCEAHYANDNCFGEELIFLLRAREFQAGIGLVDEMVKHDRFQSHGSLQQARGALVVYRAMLRDDGFRLKEREIDAFIREIDLVEETEFR